MILWTAKMVAPPLVVMTEVVVKVMMVKMALAEVVISEVHGNDGV